MQTATAIFNFWGGAYYIQLNAVTIQIGAEKPVHDCDWRRLNLFSLSHGF